MSSPYHLDERVPREELVRWLEERIEYHIREARMLRALLRSIRGGDPWRPGEKPREVRVGRKAIAYIYEYIDDSSYRLRMRLLYPMPNAREAFVHLQSVVEEIKERQARSGSPFLAEVKTYYDSEGYVTEVQVINLPVDGVTLKRVEAALKLAAETGYYIHRRLANGNPKLTVREEV